MGKAGVDGEGGTGVNGSGQGEWARSKAGDDSDILLSQQQMVRAERRRKRKQASKRPGRGVPALLGLP